MKIVSRDGQREINNQLQKILDADPQSGLAMHYDSESGSMITMLMVDGQVTGWSVTGPYSAKDAAELTAAKKAMLAQQGFPVGPAAVAGLSIN